MFPKIQNRISCEKGLTLLEVIVTLVATAIISTAIAPFLKTQAESYVNARNGKEVIQSSRIGLKRMVAELEEVPSWIDIDFGNSTQIQFDTPTQTNIRYTYNSTYKELRRGIGREGDTHVYGVQSFRIRYYNKTDSQISSFSSPRSDVWKIQIEMTVGDGSTNYELRTRVTPKGFYFN